MSPGLSVCHAQVAMIAVRAYLVDWIGAVELMAPADAFRGTVNVGWHAHRRSCSMLLACERVVRRVLLFVQEGNAIQQKSCTSCSTKILFVCSSSLS
jgi:hypothetical protein